jgi:cysteinyl-tRNA synthetase
MPVDFQVDALTAAQNRVSKLEKIFAEALAISTLSKDPITLGELLSRMCAERAVTTNVPGFFSQFILDMAYDLNTAKALTRFNEATQLLDKLVKQNVSAAALIPELENTLTYALAMWHHLGFLIEPISTLASAIQNQPRDSLHVSTPRKVKYCDITLLALPILQQTWQAIMASEFQEALMPQYIQLRQSAKVLKQWQLADEIRDHLKQHGVQLIDEKDGTCYQIET